jgi:hypothetical protein
VSRLFDAACALGRAQAKVHGDEAERLKCLADPHYFDLGVWRPGYGVIARHSAESRACTSCGASVLARPAHVPEGGVHRFSTVAAIPVDEAGVCSDCQWVDPDLQLTRKSRPRNPGGVVERADFTQGQETA